MSRNLKARTITPGYSWCSKCKQELPEDRFHHNKNRKCDGYCKECRKSYYLAKSTAPRRVYPPEGKTYCGRCKTIKENSEFASSQLIPQQGRKTKRSATCKKCIYEASVSMLPPKRIVVRNCDKHQCAKPYNFPISSDQNKLAYVAGIVDAEGTISMRYGGTAQPVFSIANDSESILREVCSVVGGSVKFLDRLKTIGGKQVLVNGGALRVTSLAGIKSVCTALLPYLILKRGRAEIVIKLTETSPSDRKLLSNEMRKENLKMVTDDVAPDKYFRISTEDSESIPDCAIAYLAGMLDGDGFIDFRFKRPQLKVGVTKACIPLWIHSVFGGYTHRRKRPGNRADQYIWQSSLSKKSWRAFLPRLISFLVLKKKHAEIALSAIDFDKAGQKQARFDLKALTAYAHQEKFRRLSKGENNVTS